MRWYELLGRDALIFGAALVGFVLLTKLDPFLLDVANRLFKKVNWITGKDNFYFARWIIKIIQPVVLLYAVSTIYAKSVSDKKGVGPAIVLMGIFMLLYVVYWPKILLRWEERRTRELLEGAQSLYFHRELAHERRFWAYLFIVSFAYKFGFSEFCHKILLALNVVAIYLISLDHPPFSRSQLKDWLASLFPSREPVAVTNE
jgi:hypothetical protein